jgi:hypothetical protein
LKKTKEDHESFFLEECIGKEKPIAELFDEKCYGEKTCQMDLVNLKDYFNKKSKCLKKLDERKA